MNANAVFTELQSYADPEKAAFYPRFFKTGLGEYGEGDIFLGVPVPKQKAIAKKYWKDIDLVEVETLLHYDFHECRLTSLFILIHHFEKSSSLQEKSACIDVYLKNTAFVNNWDLVDSSAYKLLGAFLYKKDCQILYDLASSENLWEQRISIITTLYFIKKGDFIHTLALAERLLHHSHDLMHKAVGWMLREVGNRNFDVELDFLKHHYKQMPRTTLRYAIEKFPEPLRQDFLRGEI